MKVLNGLSRKQYKETERQEKSNFAKINSRIMCKMYL